MERVMETKAKLQSMTGFRWKIAVLIFLISFVAYMDRVNLSVATPVIMQEFGFTKMDMGFIQTFFFAGYAIMQEQVFCHIIVVTIYVSYILKFLFAKFS